MAEGYDRHVPAVYTGFLSSCSRSDSIGAVSLEQCLMYVPTTQAISLLTHDSIVKATHGPEERRAIF